MPALGDHHRATAATTNPFEENVPRIQEYTAQEIAILQSRLEKQLGPEYISSRQGPGGSKVHYLAAEKVINLANEVFGFNGWSSQIQNVQIDFVDENETTGKITLGLSTIVRVTLRDGTFHEDTGYGGIENCKGKAAAFEKAKKEAATDALKRALRNFGNVLGNCLYDKDYLAKITKIKVQPSKWDAENLHRHADFAPSKRITSLELDAGDRNGGLLPGKHNAPRAPEHEDDFGGNLFDELESNTTNPDEVILPNTRPPTPKGPPPRISSEPVHQPLQQAQQQGRLVQAARQQVDAAPTPQRQQQTRTTGAGGGLPAPESSNHLPPPQHPPQQASNLAYSTPPNHSEARSSLQQSTNAVPRHTNPQQISNDLSSEIQRQNQAPPFMAQRSEAQPQPQLQQLARGHEPPVGFITGRAAEMLRGDLPPDQNVVNAIPRFNPNADSPSIRKTIGIDHQKSTPVARAALVSGAASLNPAAPIPIANAAPPPQRAALMSFNNMSENVRRQIGAPGGITSPHTNRNAYKAPTMTAKRPLAQLDGAGLAPPRQVLADVSNVVHQNDAEEAKRQRLDH